MKSITMNKYLPLFAKKILHVHTWKDQKNVEVGEFTYGKPEIHMFTSKYRLTIGKFCSIASRVIIIVDGNHRTDWISAFPFPEILGGLETNPGQPAGKRDMKIGNDVWIGHHTLILPGVQIGDGAVIAAGSVITKDVHDYEVVGGNPARHIRNRFTEEQISALKKIRWWDWPLDKIKEHYRLLQSPNVDEFIDRFG